MDIEESVKIVKEFNEKNRFRDCGRLNNAIDNILAERKKYKKKIEEWQQAYQEEKDKQFDILQNSIPKKKIKNDLDKIIEKFEAKKTIEDKQIEKSYISINGIIYLIKKIKTRLLEHK